VPDQDVADSSPRSQPADSRDLPSPDDASRVGSAARLRGVICDWGGVLTRPILDTVTEWLEADSIDRDSYRTVMRAWVTQAYDPSGESNPIHALELGKSTSAEFERLLATHLIRTDGGPVTADGLLNRMFGDGALDEGMLEVIRAARRSGLRTALLSNSWGGGYPRHLFPELFDVVVISGEVGMRKPEERIFQHALELIGLEPAECVFIDDIEANIAAARALGLTAVHHRTAQDTAAQLEELLGIPL
jgi:putative hydrolase of the HAD superfamily